MSRYWKYKERMLILYAKRCIHDDRILLNNPEYCGLEHIWYTIWTTRLTRLVQDYRSLVLGPQQWVSHQQLDSDGNIKVETRVPDFTISRVFPKRLLKFTKGTPRAWEFEVLRVVALLEVKPPPAQPTDSYISSAIQTAHNDLIEQAEILFSGDEHCKEIIGVSIAGDWWSYETLTIHNTKLRSRNVDSTFKGLTRQDSFTRGPSRMRLPTYQLGTSRSESAMGRMVDKIKTLRGFERYSGSQF